MASPRKKTDGGAASQPARAAKPAGGGKQRASRGAAVVPSPPTLADNQRYLLRLYVTGTTPASVRAIERVRRMCEERLLGRYDLEVIDVFQLPWLARDEQIIATPTLIKVLPAPLRRYIGDLTREGPVLFGLDLREVN